MTKQILHLVGLALASMVLSACSSPATSVGRLRCEYLDNPLGVDTARPRLSWELASGERGQSQSAYRVLVASTPDKLADGQGDLWDSGKVVSGETAQVAYAGKPLDSRQICYWNVTSWDQAGRASRAGYRRDFPGGAPPGKSHRYHGAFRLVTGRAATVARLGPVLNL